MKITLILLISAMILNTSCDKKNEETPEIPPESTFKMDFSDFDKNNKSLDTINANWNHASLNVGVWNLVVTANMIIPVAAFREAFNHEGVYQDDGSWIWSYTISNHTAALHAEIDGDYVLWEMYLTESGEYADFLWYTGKSRIDGKSGTWSLNQSPTVNSDGYIDIIWNRDVTAGTADIKYTNVISGAAGNGGYISYGIDPAQSLNAFYDIYAVELNNLTEIEWNSINKNGRIKNPNHFGDSEWHCWTATLEDTTCQ